MSNVYAEYKKRIRAILIDYGRQGVLTGFVPIKFYPAEGIPSAEGGIVSARNPGLIFRDGAALKLYEKVQFIDNDIQRLSYSYHYERPNGYFFRYEREQTEDLIRKPEYHLHVVLDLPHFNAPPVDIEIVLKLIAANFYSQSQYHKQIIGKEINLVI